MEPDLTRAFGSREVIVRGDDEKGCCVWKGVNGGGEHLYMRKDRYSQGFDIKFQRVRMVQTMSIRLSAQHAALQGPKGALASVR